MLPAPMSDTATISIPLEPKVGIGSRRLGVFAFGAALVFGIIYVSAHLIGDLAAVRSPGVLPYLLLGLALFVALGFEFVNGFHDTANAVATVIYTNSLDPHVAVVWSGIWNLL